MCWASEENPVSFPPIQQQVEAGDEVDFSLAAAETENNPNFHWNVPHDPEFGIRHAEAPELLLLFPTEHKLSSATELSIRSSKNALLFF